LLKFNLGTRTLEFYSQQHFSAYKEGQYTQEEVSLEVDNGRKIRYTKVYNNGFKSANYLAIFNASYDSRVPYGILFDF